MEYIKILSATALQRAWRVWWFLMLCVRCIVFFENCQLGGPRDAASPCPVRGFPPEAASKTQFVFIILFDAFLNRFLFALGSIFPPNLPPKNHQNPAKFDAKRRSILGFNF